MTHKYYYLIFYSCQNKYSLIIKEASFVNYKTLIKRRRFKIITWSKKSERHYRFNATMYMVHAAYRGRC